MEVICLETEAFYELIAQVVLRIQERFNEEPPFKWIGTEKTMELLGISSKTTLQKFRDEGKIRFSQPSKRVILYDRNSIDEFLEKNAYEAFGQKRSSF